MLRRFVARRTPRRRSGIAARLPVQRPRPHAALLRDVLRRVPAPGRAPPDDLAPREPHGRPGGVGAAVRALGRDQLDAPVQGAALPRELDLDVRLGPGLRRARTPSSIVRTRSTRASARWSSPSSGCSWGSPSPSASGRTSPRSSLAERASMEVGTVLTVFAVIALAGIPDKTMIATIVMGRPRHAAVGLAGRGVRVPRPRRPRHRRRPAARPPPPHRARGRRPRSCSPAARPTCCSSPSARRRCAASARRLPSSPVGTFACSRRRSASS